MRWRFCGVGAESATRLAGLRGCGCRSRAARPATLQRRHDRHGPAPARPSRSAGLERVTMAAVRTARLSVSGSSGCRRRSSDTRVETPPRPGPCDWPRQSGRCRASEALHVGRSSLPQHVRRPHVQRSRRRRRCRGGGLHARLPRPRAGARYPDAALRSGNLTRPQGRLEFWQSWLGPPQHRPSRTRHNNPGTIPQQKIRPDLRIISGSCASLG